MSQPKKKYAVEALGCRTNQYEAQAFRDQLAQMDYEAAAEGEDADLCIVNTCTVTQHADSHSRHLIRQLMKKHPRAQLVVTGCLAERDPASIQRLDSSLRIIPNADKEQLLEKLFPEEDIPEFSIKRFEAHTRAFVKVQDGCNSFCTYCIIPYVRGRSRSRSVDDVVREVRDLVQTGYKEVVLTGINIGDFDGGGAAGCRLADLIRAVDKVDGLERLRVSSIDPDEIDAELQDVILNGKRTCRSMHIVLQAGSNMILKRMNRKYTRQVFLDTVRTLSNACPDFTVTTDIIVGFPGETEQDFAETLDVMREVRFAKVHMFPYSDRPRTKAATYPNKVPSDMIASRKSRLLRAAEETALQLRQQFIGRTMTVLLENREEKGRFFGHTDNFLGVFIEGHTTKLDTNQLVTVRLVDNQPEGLVGVMHHFPS